MLAANASFPKGSLPGTMKTTSSAMRLSTVARSPLLLASSHLTTNSRIACSSFCIADCTLNAHYFLRVLAAFLAAREREAAERLAAALRACRDNDFLEAAACPSRLSAPRVARERLADA